MAGLAHRCHCRVPVIALAAAGMLAGAASAQLTITQISRNLGGGSTARGWQAVVDLTSPRVRIVTTAP